MSKKTLAEMSIVEIEAERERIQLQIDELTAQKRMLGVIKNQKMRIENAGGVEKIKQQKKKLEELLELAEGGSNG